MTADYLLADGEQLESPPPGAARLAVLLSPATRIEPELIRRMRLTVTPWLDVGAEADLWFSDWVGVRSVDSIMLRPQILPYLRAQLAELLRESPAQHPVHSVWPVISRCHVNLSPALRTEERITFLSLAAGSGEVSQAAWLEIDQALESILRGLVAEGRTGIADWYSGAWRRIPEAVRNTKSGWLLSQIVAGQFPELSLSIGESDPGGLTLDDASMAIATLDDVRLGVMHDGDVLTVGTRAFAGASAIAVPATRPRLLEVSWRVKDKTNTVSLALANGEISQVPVGKAAVRLRTARGAIYDLAPPQSRPSVKRRLGRLGSRTGGANPVLAPLIKSAQAAHPDVDIRVIERAYEVAAKWHAGQLRKSGDPFITHPLAVATILAELGMDQETLCAALLHDAIEDTDYTLAELRRDFGDDIAALVGRVTKLDKVKYGEAAQAETVRKMVVAMSGDARVLVIKLADRLHNMRTLRYLPRERQERKSRETLEVYAPLAHRLGMNTVKWELEDLAFATLWPKRYDEIARLVSERAPRREAFLQEVIEEVSADLRESKIKARVTGRARHLYSIYQEMVEQRKSFDDIYDLVGIRILVDTVRDCYAVLGAVHARWNPVPRRFKDYIAMPKFNMYQSLHTTVFGPGGKPVELQIKTWAMHRRETAAGWSEETVNAPEDARGEYWMPDLVNWREAADNPADYLEALRFEVGTAEVYVFTPRGEVIALPQGATPVDFAYAIHTDVGHRTIGARVDGRLVPLESTLSNGDVVEVLTSKAQDAGPSQDWLGFVKSPGARSKIRRWFADERRQTSAELGKTMIAAAMRGQNLPLQRQGTASALLAIAHELRYKDLSALYTAVGDDRISVEDVVTRLVSKMGILAEAQDDSATATEIAQPAPGGSGVSVEGSADVWARLAKCCNPMPGDEITGFVTRGNGVSVHRTDCVNVQHLTDSQPERLVAVHWSPKESSRFLTTIVVEALDRTGMLSDITRAIAEQHVNILSATVSTRRDQVILSKFTFDMGDPGDLRHVLKAVRGVAGVYDAHRVVS